MSTNWLTVAGPDLAEVLNWTILEQATQNLDPSNHPANQAVDWDADNRSTEQVNNAVAELRGAIQAGGKYPLSVTAGAVPPEARAHVLYLAAWRLLNSTPNLNMAILTEKGISTPFAQFYKDAMEYIKGLRTGGAFVQPADPTGVDYQTAVSDTNIAISGVMWGDLEGSDTDYAQGFTVLEDGSKITLPTDDMRTW